MWSVRCGPVRFRSVRSVRVVCSALSETRLFQKNTIVSAAKAKSVVSTVEPNAITNTVFGQPFLCCKGLSLLGLETDFLTLCVGQSTGGIKG